MTDRQFLHEAIYRGEQALERLGEQHITIAGAGTIGSNLADTLTRQGAKQLRLIDCDRVETHNVSTQVYGLSDVGTAKVAAAGNIVFRNVGVEIESLHKQLKANTVKRLLRDTELVVDAFDNSQSRQLLTTYCREQELACLHVGLFEDYGEVVWNDCYTVPADVAGDVCDYALARNLAMLTVSIAAEEVVDFLCSRQPRQQSWSVTLKDLSIRPYR